MESVFRQALAHHNAGRLDEAEALYGQAAGWKPEWTLGNLGAILRVTGRLAEAEAVLREALAADPPNLSVRHSLGMTLLQLGRYPEGWRLYEARHELYPPPTPPHLPRWQGEDLAGKHVLVVAEQGLGDQILLSRFVSHLAARAAVVTLVTSPALAPLFAALPARVTSAWEDVAADLWTPLGSIPRWLDLSPADAPAPTLPAPRPKLMAENQPSGVGLMLEGAPGNANNANRLPGPAVARAIRGLAAFVDLSPQATGARDFAETAAIVAGLERVVTVDTSVAHLAGALGKPCLILMSRPAIDWYANWHDDRTPWYASARLIRQRTPGDWAGVIADLAQALSA